MFQISISPEEIGRLELASFPGEIHVIDSLGEEFGKAVSYLKRQKVIGFDTETRPTFSPDQRSNGTALLQLSGAEKAFLFRIKHMGGIPRRLCAILANPNIVKVGAAIHDDVSGLQRFAGFQPQNFVDLQKIGWEYGIRDKSVKKMTAIILGFKISKAQQLSNWEAEKLSESQQRYAATDAWVCREMYLRLMQSEKAPLTPEQLHPELYPEKSLMEKVYLRPRREDSILRFHPWVFSGAIAQVTGNPAEGDLVGVYSAEGEYLATGHYQIGSIAVRILSFDEDPLAPDFWEKMVRRAFQMRVNYGLHGSVSTNCYRLIHGEGDGLPGLIVDHYDGVCVLQAHSVGMFKAKNAICEALKAVYGDTLKAVYDKSSGTAPFKAGLDLVDGYLYRAPGFEADETVVLENGNKFHVNWNEGQKTGFFLDQRENRAAVGRLAKGREVLNLFCYTGGFSIYALAGGASHVDSVDSSRKAMEMVDRNVALNGFPEGRHTSYCADAIEFLRDVPEGKYDLMIVDPPAFAKHRGALKNALRAYQRLNAAAIAKVAPGGFVFTFSCSQVVDKEAFALAVFSAAAQTGRSVRILDRLNQPADHAVNIYHPEGEYLKGLLLYVE